MLFAGSDSLYLGKPCLCGKKHRAKHKELAAKFAPIAQQLADNEAKIVAELKDVQGKAVDIGGYFQPDIAKLDAVMRPSATFNKVVAEI